MVQISFSQYNNLTFPIVTIELSWKKKTKKRKKLSQSTVIKSSGVCSVERCCLEFHQNHNRHHILFLRLHVRCGFKPVYFSNFGFFLPNPKLIFPFVLDQILNYCASFSLFWVDFPIQHLLVLLNFFIFFTRVIKLLIIYLILKIN